jgi:hypothetical protein
MSYVYECAINVLICDVMRMMRVRLGKARRASYTMRLYC